MKIFNKIIISLLIALLFIQESFAMEPYKGYVYDEWDNAIPAPNGYIPKDVFRGEDIGVGALKQPKDLFVDNNGDLYILDSGNGRIVILDKENKLKKVIDEFSLNGKEYKLKEPQGFFIDKEGKIFIADTGNEKVVISNQDGIISKIIEKPVTNIYPQSLAFKPTRIIVDSSEVIYVLVKNLYYGAVTYDIDGKFLGYYGSNKVRMTAKMILDKFWKKILSKKQVDKMSRYVPIEYPGFDIDDLDFVYTVTDNVNHEDPIEQIKKLNPMGTNIYPSEQFGDMEIITQGTYGTEIKTINTRFIDVEVDENHFVNALDFERGRIFQYDQDGELLFVFGCYGEQLGTFSSPIAIESRDGEIFILDDKRSNITTFKLSSFGEVVHKAVKLYNDGLYNEAVEPWEEVIKRNSNYNTAYIGIGKAFMYMEDYEQALKYFELGYSQKQYSKSFKEYRTQKIREKFLLYAVITIILFFLLISLVNKNSFLRKIISNKKLKNKVVK